MRDVEMIDHPSMTQIDLSIRKYELVKDFVSKFSIEDLEEEVRKWKEYHARPLPEPDTET